MIKKSTKTYNCLCGKSHKSRDTVRRHKQKYELEKAEISDTPENARIIKRINMTGEFDKMTEIVNPKKNETEKESAYQCGQCSAKFNERIRYCPACGADFGEPVKK
jgi:hypothetical protein